LNFTTFTKLAANWCISELPAVVSQENLSELHTTLTPKSLASMIDKLGQNVVSSKQAKEIFPHLVKGESLQSIIDRLHISQVSDTAELSEIINKTLDEQPQSIIDYHNGKDRALGFLVGQIMKKTKGQANPVITNELLLAELTRRKPE